MKIEKEGKKVETDLEKAYREAKTVKEKDTEDSHWLVDSAFGIFQTFTGIKEKNGESNE